MVRRTQITVIGSLNADLVQRVERLPRPGETLVGSDILTFSGGKGANQAFAAGLMGACVSMIGQVGGDGLASVLLKSLHSAGVSTESVGVADVSTGAAVIHVLPDGENVIVISPGANATLTPALAAKRLRGLVRGSILLAQLEIPIETVDRALQVAKQRGATTILDPAPARALPSRLLRNVDFLTPNETEAQTLLGGPSNALHHEAEIKRTASRLLALGPRAVVLKLGSRGCMVATPAEHIRLPGLRVQPVDTTAAGDAFNGAFAAALAEGRPIAESAAFANAAAGLSVSRPGAQASIPSRPAVERILDTAGT